jgi:hypothetical protein
MKNKKENCVCKKIFIDFSYEPYGFIIPKIFEFGIMVIEILEIAEVIVNET